MSDLSESVNNLREKYNKVIKTVVFLGEKQMLSHFDFIFEGGMKSSEGFEYSKKFKESDYYNKDAKNFYGLTKNKIIKIYGLDIALKYNDFSYLVLLDSKENRIKGNEAGNAQKIVNILEDMIYMSLLDRELESSKETISNLRTYLNGGLITNDFINEIDKYFSDWNDKEESKEGKLDNMFNKRIEKINKEIEEGNVRQIMLTKELNEASQEHDSLTDEMINTKKEDSLKYLDMTLEEYKKLEKRILNKKVFKKR